MNQEEKKAKKENSGDKNSNLQSKKAIFNTLVRNLQELHQWQGHLLSELSCCAEEICDPDSKIFSQKPIKD